jgi:[ribosomal protein S18]-alanine N-acetyltransferase
VSDLAIEAVEESDLDAMAAIEAARFPDPWSRDLLAEEISLVESRRYTKAVEAGRLLGYLGLMYVEHDVHVNTIAVAEGAEGRGVGSWLLLEGIEASLLRGAKHLTLEVAADNLRAQALYRRFGLAPVGVRRGYYPGGVDAIVMWCRDLDAEAEVARRTAILAGLEHP